VLSTCETFFGGTSRTLSAATGLLFSKPPQMNWNASETVLSPVWDNIDNAGTKGTVLLKRFSESSLRDGLGAILVDHPTPPTVVDGENKPRALREDEAQRLGLRPTWALYGRTQITNWRTGVINNRRTLTMIVFSEQADVDDGAFGTKKVQRYRVLRLILTPDGYQGTWEVFELRGDAVKAESYVRTGGGAYTNKSGQIADFLPVAIAYTGRTDAPLTASIPLLDVAWANLAHWQQSTNLRFYREYCAFPQRKIKGNLMPDAATGQPGKIRSGPGVAIHVSADGDAMWDELSGTSMVQLESGINEKLKQMSQLGLSFLMGDTRAAETAEAKRLDATAENSSLSTAAQGIDDAANAALEFTAWYVGIEKSGAPVIGVNRDFESTLMDAATMGVYVQLAAAGFPKDLILEAFVAGGRIEPDADLKAIEAKWQGAVDAEQKIKEAEAAAKADAIATGQNDPALAA
jgi:hypothetical protein